MIAKTRVAHVKPISLPKLKACEAFTLAELIYEIIESLNINENIYLLTDFTLTVSGILKPPTKGNLFSSKWHRYIF